MTGEPTTDDYPVDVSVEVLRRVCDTYQAELSAAVTDYGDDPSTHAEVRAALAVLPRVVRDELRALLDGAFPSDDCDWHYALEDLHDQLVGRLRRLDAWLANRP